MGLLLLLLLLLLLWVVLGRRGVWTRLRAVRGVGRDVVDGRHLPHGVPRGTVEEVGPALPPRPKLPPALLQQLRGQVRLEGVGRGPGRRRLRRRRLRHRVRPGRHARRAGGTGRGRHSTRGYLEGADLLRGRRGRLPVVGLAHDAHSVMQPLRLRRRGLHPLRHVEPVLPEQRGRLFPGADAVGAASEATVKFRGFPVSLME